MGGFAGVDSTSVGGSLSSHVVAALPRPLQRGMKRMAEAVDKAQEQETDLLPCHAAKGQEAGPLLCRVVRRRLVAKTPSNPVDRRRTPRQLSPEPEPSPCGANERGRAEEATDLESAVAVALRRYDAFFADYLLEEVSSSTLGACAAAERQVHQRYEGLCAEFMGLLPYTMHDELPTEFGGGRSYSVVRFRGQKLPQRVLRRCTSSDSEMEDMLQHVRESAHGRARDALCGMLAVLASRPEKSWLEAFDTESEVSGHMKAHPRDKKIDATRAVSKKLAARGVRGYFAHALVKPTSTFRIALSHDAAGILRPGSLMLTYRMPLNTALLQMDDDGPLPLYLSDAIKKKELDEHEFALQDLRRCSGPGNAFEFTPALELDAEHKLRELLQSRSPVILLDAVAALAPRAEAREKGLSDVVKAELATFFAQAKARGQTVIFMLGGEEPQVLAEKVYLREPFTDHGMRCGYLRWRRHAADPWARQKESEKRQVIGLQLP